MNKIPSKFLTFLSAALLAVVAHWASAAPPIQVTAADPSSTTQGTLSLDVTVTGSGFDSSAAVDFLVTGTTNPGGITVKKVTVASAKKLVATIDVADTAAVSSFDVQVTQSGGRKGKGTSLFAVVAKVANDACARSGLDFPAFLFWKQVGNSRQIYLADATGACTRQIDIGDSNPLRPVLAYPLNGSSNRGRIAWYTGYHELMVVDFSVSGTTVTPEPKRVVLVPDFPWGLDISRDGVYAYTATYDNIVERIAIDNPADRVIVRSFELGTRWTRVESVNGDQSALYLNERVLAADGTVLRTELVRLDLMTRETSVLATTSNANWLYQSAADLNSNRIAYVDYLSGSDNCYLLQIADGATGAVFSNGQPRFGRFPTWHAGKIIAEGYKPPDRRNKCDAMNTIIEVDPDTSAQRVLTSGAVPNGS